MSPPVPRVCSQDDADPGENTRNVVEIISSMTEEAQMEPDLCESSRSLGPTYSSLKIGSKQFEYAKR